MALTIAYAVLLTTAAWAVSVAMSIRSYRRAAAHCGRPVTRRRAIAAMTRFIFR
jgi:hypothetical protein